MIEMRDVSSLYMLFLESRNLLVLVYGGEFY